MNSGRLKPTDESVQTDFNFFPEESIARPRGNSMNASPSQSPAKTKPETEATVSSFESKAAAET